MKSHLHKESFRENNFGKFSVSVTAIDSWNEMQGQMGEMTLKRISNQAKYIYIYIYENKDESTYKRCVI